MPKPHATDSRRRPVDGAGVLVGLEVALNGLNLGRPLVAGVHAEDGVVGLAEGVVGLREAAVRPLVGLGLYEGLVHERARAAHANVVEQGGGGLVDHLHGPHGVAVHARAHRAVVVEAVRHGGAHQREKRAGAARVHVGADALDRHLLVRLGVEQLREDVVGAALEHVGLALVVVAPGDLHAAHERALRAVVGAPRERDYLRGVVAHDAQLGVGRVGAVGHASRLDDPRARAHGERAGYEVGVVHGERCGRVAVLCRLRRGLAVLVPLVADAARRLGVGEVARHPGAALVARAGDDRALVHEQTGPLVGHERRRMQAGALALVHAEAAPLAVVVPAVVRREPAEPDAHHALHAGVRLVSHAAQPRLGVARVASLLHQRLLLIHSPAA